MRKLLVVLCATIALTAAGRSWADTLLVYEVHSPERVNPIGRKTGGTTQKRILIGSNRVRVEDETSVKILLKDKHEIYTYEAGFKIYCRHGFPLDLKSEIPSDLYENLHGSPQDSGPGTVQTKALGTRTVGRWPAQGTQIDVVASASEEMKASAWVTDQLPQVDYALVSELLAALSSLSRSRPAAALTVELAKLPGVPVRIERDLRNAMEGASHQDEQLLSVEDHAATDEDYRPPKGIKRGEYFLCFDH
jgi:hypothetical protein